MRGGETAGKTFQNSKRDELPDGGLASFEVTGGELESTG